MGLGRGTNLDAHPTMHIGITKLLQFLIIKKDTRFYINIPPIYYFGVAVQHNCFYPWCGEPSTKLRSRHDANLEAHISWMTRRRDLTKTSVSLYAAQWKKMLNYATRVVYIWRQ